MRSGVLLGLGLLLGVGSPAAAAPIRLGFSSWYPDAPLNVAEVNGYWKKLGLEVEVHHFMLTQEVIAALNAGQIDLGVDMIGSWLAQIAEGSDLVVLGELDWSHGGDKLVIKRDLDLAAAKGSRIGVYYDNLPVLLFAQRALAKRGAKLEDYTVVEIEDISQLKALFATGRLTQAVLYEPQATLAVTEGGGEVVASTAEFNGIMPEGVAATRQAMARITDEELVKFWRGWFQAVRWAADPANRARYHAIIREQTYKNDEAGDDATIEAGLANTRIHTAAQSREIHAADGSHLAWLTTAEEFWRQAGKLRQPLARDRILRLEPIRTAAAAEQAPP